MVAPADITAQKVGFAAALRAAEAELKGKPPAALGVAALRGEFEDDRHVCLQRHVGLLERVADRGVVDRAMDLNIRREQAPPQGRRHLACPRRQASFFLRNAILRR